MVDLSRLFELQAEMTHEAPICDEWTVMVAFLRYGHMNWLMPPKSTGDLIKACMKPAKIKEFEAIHKRGYH